MSVFICLDLQHCFLTDSSLHVWTLKSLSTVSCVGWKSQTRAIVRLSSWTCKGSFLNQQVYSSHILRFPHTFPVHLPTMGTRKKPTAPWTTGSVRFNYRHAEHYNTLNIKTVSHSDKFMQNNWHEQALSLWYVCAGKQCTSFWSSIVDSHDRPYWTCMANSADRF